MTTVLRVAGVHQTYVCRITAPLYSHSRVFLGDTLPTRYMQVYTLSLFISCVRWAVVIHKLEIGFGYVRCSLSMYLDVWV